MTSVKQYIDFLHEQRQRLDACSLPLLNARRDAAASALVAGGFPSQKVERYRYTDVAAAFAPNYGICLKDAGGAAGSALSDEDVACCQTHYGTLADVKADAIVALNTMLVDDLLVLHIAAGVSKSHPVQVTQTLRATAPLMQNRRMLIVAEAGAHVQVILNERADADQDFLVTQVTEVFVGPGAQVEFYDIESTHARFHRFHQFYADVAEGGRLTHASITLAGGLSRNQTDVRLSGEGGEVHLLGCAVTDGQQHVDNNTLIDHRAPGCVSRELYKYVVDQHSTGAFAGRVLVREAAQQTDSEEQNANLVCTDQARMWTQPMLEIYADDVKCSHGSTVGQLNADALFYMAQRGIGESEARTMLKQAFAAEVVAEIPLEALRQRLHAMIEKRFRSCEDCRLCK